MTTDDHAARGHDTRPHYPLVEETAGGSVVLRLMVPADREAVHAFALELPSHDLMFLRRDITQIEQIDAWLAEIQTGDITTVLAERDGVLLGYSSVERSPWSWSRHVAELRVVVAADARGGGLGRLLTREAFRVAFHIGVEKMTAQMTTDQRGALNVFQRLGFENEALLRGQVKDRDGQKYDLILLRREVSDFEGSVLLEEEA